MTTNVQVQSGCGQLARQADRQQVGIVNVDHTPENANMAEILACMTVRERVWMALFLCGAMGAGGLALICAWVGMKFVVAWLLGWSE